MGKRGLSNELNLFCIDLYYQEMNELCATLNSRSPDRVNLCMCRLRFDLFAALLCTVFRQDCALLRSLHQHIIFWRRTLLFLNNNTTALTSMTVPLIVSRRRFILRVHNFCCRREIRFQTFLLVLKFLGLLDEVFRI